MTMPTLIAHHQKQQTIVKLKKAYSEVQQALQLAQNDYGPVEDWEYGTAFEGASAENIANKYLVPYMNVIKNCGAASGCLSGEVYDLKGNAVAYNYSDSSTRTAKFIVNSGYSIGVTSGGSYATVQVVINNKKDKLAVGKEVFFFSVGQDRRKIKDREAWKEGDYGCSKEAALIPGMNCIHLIMADGWQIAPDYPW